MQTRRSPLAPPERGFGMRDLRVWGPYFFFRNVLSILLEDDNCPLVLSNLCFLGSQNVDLLADFSCSIGSSTDCMSGKLEMIS